MAIVRYIIFPSRGALHAQLGTIERRFNTPKAQLQKAECIFSKQRRDPISISPQRLTSHLGLKLCPRVGVGVGFPLLAIQCTVNTSATRYKQ